MNIRRQGCYHQSRRQLSMQTTRQWASSLPFLLVLPSSSPFPFFFLVFFPAYFFCLILSLSTFCLILPSNFCSSSAFFMFCFGLCFLLYLLLPFTCSLLPCIIFISLISCYTFVFFPFSWYSYSFFAAFFSSLCLLFLLCIIFLHSF